MEAIRNCRLNFSTLALGRRFGLAATNWQEIFPTSSRSITVQMLTASVITRLRAPAFPSTRAFVYSLIESEMDALSHSEIRMFLASRASR